jgi:phosphoglucosamine mutase
MPQHMVNVRVNSKSAVMSNPQVLAAVAELERKLAGRGRVLLRPSGTEPLIRVMVEGEDEAAVTAHAIALADVVSASRA